MTLIATTCLGDNTVPMLEALVGQLRQAGVDIEFDATLDPGERVELFTGGRADLAWACGLLTVEQLAAGLDMTISAAPIFAGETTPTYRSALVVRVDDPACSIAETFSGRVAVNEYGSWSGYVGFDRWLRAQGHRIDEYATTVISGSHVASMQLVRGGSADVAAIDHTIWDARSEVQRDSLRVLTTTDDWPAPPISLSPRALGVVDAVLRSDGPPAWRPASRDDYELMASA